MNFFILLRQWFSSILANKLRSSLSILGIVIGICSVVIMLAIWEGAKQSILSSFDSVDNLISIEKKYWQWDMMSKSSVSNPISSPEIITMEMAQEIEQKVFWVESVVYAASVSVWDMKYNSKPLYGQLSGISSDFLQQKWYKIQYGSAFSEKNFQEDEKVLILWHYLISEHFGKTNPIWEKIYIWWSPFIVVWILEKKNWNTDYSMFIPATTAVNRLWAKELYKLEVFTDKQRAVNDVKKDLQYFLFRKSWVFSPSEAPFSVRTNEDVLKQVDQIVGNMQLLLWAIGSIALIVGGIWIMNIMLVSVTERTREIGIRKAIGATKLHILSQFLIEAVTLSMIWCVIAVWICYSWVYAINSFVPNFQAVITMSVVMISSMVSILMGIIFGLMPAWKAARLKPIDALRFE